MLLLSARASHEIMNAIDANTKTLKSEIGDVKEALKDLKKEVSGMKETLKHTEDKIDGQTET